MRLPPALPEQAAPIASRPETISTLIEDEGPAEGLTLDAAIKRMLDANLDVLALRYEIPQADADILTAGLRTNPLIYVDDQFLPYGAFTNARPGDRRNTISRNITYPIDVSHKRNERLRVTAAPPSRCWKSSFKT